MATKIKIQCVMNDRSTVTRTAYLLPRMQGFLFAVTRDDDCKHGAKWYVCHYGSGVKAGVACHTRRDAIDAFIERFNSLVKSNRAGVGSQITSEPTINNGLNS